MNLSSIRHTVIIFFGSICFGLLAVPVMSPAQESAVPVPVDTSRISDSIQSSQVHSARDLYLNPANRDFKAIQESVELYFSTRDRGKGSGYKQWKRWENMMKDRLNPEGQIINYSKHIEELAPRRNTGKRSLTGDWKNIGPRALELGANADAPGLGRINCIAFHPTNANVIYIGAPSGGLWKTTNGGTSWTELAQDFAQLGISGIAVNYNNANEIFVLTGDGDGGVTTATGVHKSANGGVTWSNTTLPWGATDVVRGYKLAMHPSDPSILFAATTQGMYKTINSGLSWTRTYSNSVHDFEFKPGDPTTMYLVSGADWKISSNTGETWPLGNTMSGATRMALAVTPNNPSVVYLVAGPARNDGTPTTPDYRFRGLYYSTNSAQNFSFMSNSPNILGLHIDGLDSHDQAGFDLAIAASHTNANSILVGAINLWSSSDNGSNWTNRAHWSIGQPPDTTLPYVHADIHALDINPVDNKLYCGSDGGIFVSSDFGVTWRNLSRGISVSQFYRIDGIESNPDHIMMGAQDNGTMVWKGKIDTVKNIYGADGMTCKINPNNESTIYYSAQNGLLYRSITGGDDVTYIRPGNSQSVWVTPFDMDPNNSEILFAAFRDTIWRTLNASTATTSSWTPYLPGGVNLDWFRFVHVSKASSNVYVCSDKKIYKSPNTVTTNSWTDITTNLPVNIGGVNITSITSSHFDPDRIWVSLSGLSPGNKVYFSGNGGVSWTNYSGSLPNVPINTIEYAAFDGWEAFFVGTDLGFYFFSGLVPSGDWIDFSTGLPNVSVRDIEVNTSSRRVYAGTFGRGLWVSDFYYNCQPDLVLTQANDPSGGMPGTTYDKASNSITSSRMITGDSGHVIYQAGNEINLVSGFTVEHGNFFKAVINGCWVDDPESN